MPQHVRTLSEIVTTPSPPPDWLVPGLLHRGTMVILAGDAGIGKTTLSYTLAVAKATGQPFLGRPMPPGRVLYFDEENSEPDFEEYLRWVWRGLGRPTPSLLDENLRMDRFRLAATAPRHFNYMLETAIAWKPELIILDTATSACHIIDENDNGEANAAITRLRGVQRAAGPRTTMLILKHAKLDPSSGQRRIRGAKVWMGSTDATLFHLANPGQPKKDGLRPSRLEPEKVRAFGLRAPLRIVPAWVEAGTEKGLSLTEGKKYSDESLAPSEATLELLDSIVPKQ